MLILEPLEGIRAIVTTNAIGYLPWEIVSQRASKGLS